MKARRGTPPGYQDPYGFLPGSLPGVGQAFLPVRCWHERRGGTSRFRAPVCRHSRSLHATGRPALSPHDDRSSSGERVVPERAPVGGSLSKCSARCIEMITPIRPIGVRSLRTRLAAHTEFQKFATESIRLPRPSPSRSLHPCLRVRISCSSCRMTTPRTQ